MPDTVEFAGNHVFDGCANLESVRLSAALEQVDPTMFLGCGALAEVELAMPLVRLEGDSFSDAPVATWCSARSWKRSMRSPSGCRTWSA